MYSKVKKEQKKLPELIKDPEVTKFINDPFVPNLNKQIRAEQYHETKTKKDKVEREEIKKNYQKNKNDPYPKSHSPYSVNPPGFVQQPSVNVQVYQPQNTQQPNDSNKHFKDVVDMLPFYAREPTLNIPNLIDVPRYSIINKSFVNLDAGPRANHRAISNVYENIFPKSKVELSFSSLKNRLQMTRYIRSVLISEGDGEEKLLDSYSPNSLIGHLKLLHLNPFGDKSLTQNPYKTLPPGMLVYSSCYPIKYDENKSNTSCASNSTGLMVKIYQMSNIEYNAFASQEWDGITATGSVNNIRAYKLLNEWTRTNKCPHFVRMHAYYLFKNADIDFESLDNKMPVVYGGGLIGNFIGQAGNVDIAHGPNDNFGPIKEVLGASKKNKNIINEGGAVIVPSPTVPISKDCVIILTEAPTYTMDEWKKNKYDSNGKKEQQIYSSVYKKKITDSLKFQCFYSMQFMNKKIHPSPLPAPVGISGLTKYEMFVKDVEKKIHGKYWIYSINGIKFYIPNYGFIMLFDIKFEYDKKIFSENTSPFTYNLSGIRKYSRFMHNRIGTLVTDNEMLNIDNSGNIHSYIIGELAVIKEGLSYKYVMIIKKFSGAAPITYDYVSKLKMNSYDSVAGALNSTLYKLQNQDVQQNNGEFAFTEKNIIEEYSF